MFNNDNENLLNDCKKLKTWQDYIKQMDKQRMKELTNEYIKENNLTVKESDILLDFLEFYEKNK